MDLCCDTPFPKRQRRGNVSITVYGPFHSNLQRRTATRSPLIIHCSPLYTPDHLSPPQARWPSSVQGCPGRHSQPPRMYWEDYLFKFIDRRRPQTLCGPVTTADPAPGPHLPAHAGWNWHNMVIILKCISASCSRSLYLQELSNAASMESSMDTPRVPVALGRGTNPTQICG